MAALRSGAQLHGDTIGSLLIGSANVLIINFYLPAREIGFYYFAIQSLALLAILPTVAELISHADIASSGAEAAWENRKPQLWVTVALVGAAAALAYVAAPMAVPLVAGQRFAGAVPVLRALLVTVVAQSFVSQMNPYWIGRLYIVQLALSQHWHSHAHQFRLKPGRGPLDLLGRMLLSANSEHESLRATTYPGTQGQGLAAEQLWGASRA